MRLKQPQRLDLVVALTTFGSLGALLAALAVTTEKAGEWAAGVLVNLGASVLLVVPVYLLNKRLDKRIERVRVETKSSVQALSDRVETFEHEVERRIDDISASVSSRLEQERSQDRAAFDTLVDAPTREVVHEALRRANALGLISGQRGPRICVSQKWQVFVRVDYDENPDYFAGFEDITFTVESLEGGLVNAVPWHEGQQIEDVMVQLGRSVLKAASDEDLDVKGLLGGLRDALVVAQERPSCRPIWQLCPPQWAVTESGIATYGDTQPISVSPESLSDPGFWQHVLERRHLEGRPRIDADSYHAAKEVALLLCRYEPPF
ncbi:hypothetical protein [Micromonospora coxensis]|uniref:hypothetical protein n=1 Tax=Micromonospora coxensis TaxID=356852 RepID=UPI00342B1CA0